MKFSGRQGQPGLNGPPGRDNIRFIPIPGDQGTVGRRGEPGKQGEHGKNGLPGFRGEVGPPGPDGLPGEVGTSGFPGKVSFSV